MKIKIINIKIITKRNYYFKTGSSTVKPLAPWRYYYFETGNTILKHDFMISSLPNLEAQIGSTILKPEVTNFENSAIFLIIMKFLGGGCMRPFDWPDLPSASIFNCQGQCRNGSEGRGPTDPRWLSQYCAHSANFFNPITKKFESKTFWLCTDEIFESENGLSIYGKSGKFETRPISAEKVRRTWSEYLKAVDNTLKITRSWV